MMPVCLFVLEITDGCRTDNFVFTGRLQGIAYILGISGSPNRMEISEGTYDAGTQVSARTIDTAGQGKAPK